MPRSVDQRRRENDIKLRLALRAGHIGVWDWSLETGEMQYSARARAICGFPPDAPVTFEMARQVTHPEDYPRTSAMAKRALDPAIREKTPYEYRIIRADDGQTRWVIAHGEALFADTETGQVATRYIGTIQDITERKLAEQALRESELRQRLAIEAARMAVWEFDIATETITTSPDLNRMFGLPPDRKPTIADIRACYGPGEREKVQAAAQAALAAGETRFEAEFRCRRPDGNLYWLLLRAEMLKGPDGSFERVIGVLMDIDASKRSADRQMLLLRELNHRVKNSLSVVQSLATQSFRQGGADPEALTAFRSRLQALAKANDVLLQDEWNSFPLTHLVDRIIAPYRDPEERFELSGEDIHLPPRLNVPLALILHELCTNAAKYGALSVETGRVRIAWRRVGEDVELEWEEIGGPAFHPEIEFGFGTSLISRILAVEIGHVELEPRPAGMYCRMLLNAPLPQPIPEF